MISTSPAEYQVTGATILDLFRQVVLDHPDSEAVVFEKQELSYRQLDNLANQFANALVRQGIRPGQCVGLCIERCPEAIAAMLGVLKAGAVFVPLDPEYPLDRVRYMIEDAQIRVVVTHDKTSNRLAQDMDQALELVWIDSCSFEFARTSDAFSPTRIQGTDLAYIMYTSGSTGRPKGVQIEHGALVAYCLADIEVYRLTAQDRTLQFSTLNFDIAIEEIFPPLLIGSCVVVRPRERPAVANELSCIIQQYGVTAIHLATAYWHEWVDLMLATEDCVPNSLRLVIATGEKVSVEHYRRWQKICHQDVLWCNAYGPTETTVTATVFIPEGDFQGTNMPIGKALPGYDAWILDSQLQPLKAGETGELFIGGPALARGYLNRPELTEAAFVEAELSDYGPVRLYRTGDLARWLPDGNLEFAGRIDHQIKLGSYRIEPGEIEAELNRHPAVRESLVSIDEVDGQKYLLAYVAVGTNQVSIEQLVDSLRDGLPAYMVPARYILIEKFPKTINGKIDRAALPDASTSRTAEHGAYVAPRNPFEARLAELWQSVLHLPKVGVFDNFFALGGSSLLVTRIVAELTNDLDIELPVRDFFANPTIASSARHLQQLTGEEVTELEEDVVRERRHCREQQPMVHADFIGHGDRKLFSVRYQPRCSDPRWCNVRQHGVLICHSLGHEYTRAYRNVQQLALMLCAAGFDVLRFDYYGTGNSTGSCSDCRAESLQADTRKAASYFREISGISRLSVLGIRLGATVAATTPFDDPLDNLMLWDPVVDGQQFFRTLDGFHHHALNSQTRYACVVSSSEVPQVFGHHCDDEKRNSLGRIRLPKAGPARNLLLASNGYAAAEPGLEEVKGGWNCVETRDDIHWHQPGFTESAFSSPESYREIAQYLSQGV